MFSNLQHAHMPLGPIKSYTQGLIFRHFFFFGLFLVSLAGLRWSYEKVFFFFLTFQYMLSGFSPSREFLPDHGGPVLL